MAEGLLAGKTAVITGGAQGIGLAIAERFVAEGARVVLGDMNAEAVAAAAAALGEDVAVGIAGTVTSSADVDALIAILTAGAYGAVQSGTYNTRPLVPEVLVKDDRYAVVRPRRDVDALIATAIDRFGSLDVMVNNAGITRDATMRNMTEEHFDQVMNVHLKGTWLGTRAAAAVMREQGSGAIVNMSSISGKVGNIGQTNYSAAKAGIVGLTKAAAKEVAFKGVRINAIQPGLIRTAMTEAMPQKAWDSKMAEIPMGRAGEPDEIAKVALFLASDLSSYMTGTVMEVTGGRYM
ncbi:3-oxoacyl-ACP reductase FabG [Gordonia sp. (in: high G+C Gram-positive bacteria)]|uniref:3-oxoacyl-ACP reductase FabG n=1 Tax=Gordonia sp. (in: high G+C Gram-positive bacteria) TaxID=84139 RepID=UPI0026247BD4|nr:3-oxoacyl-ACP reductase FabG [Gordonia sp. (in: high G+C Gram-positive bacteria)]